MWLVAAATTPAFADDKQVCSDSYTEVPTLRDTGKYSEARQKAEDCARVCGGLSAAAKEFASECRAWADELAPMLTIAVVDASGAKTTATVRVDGKPVTDLSKPVRVTAGTHKVHAETNSGAPPVDLEVTALDGKATPVNVQFAAPEVKTTPLTPDPPKDPKDPKGADAAPSARPMWPVGLGYGLTAVGLGVGIGTLVAAGADPEASVTCPTNAGCPAADDFLATRDTLQNAGLWSLVGAGVVAGVTTGYLIWAVSGKPAKTGSAMPRVGFFVMPGVGTVSASGEF